ncbi:NHL repeat-containing protein [Gracilimonas sp.]|uniref:NHL repeat-containing protein n=1 Tax=Gracilimonas sp. TaxID=1974203 RepID=UPI0032EDE458
MICLIFLLLFFSFPSLKAQPLQKIYSGLDNATSLYVTQNSIYVVEQGNNRLLKLDHSGKLLETIGGKGSGNYQFSKPVDVDATNGLKIFVTDYNNRRVQVFDKRGQYLSSISASDTFGDNRPYNPTQIAVNGLGEVFFVDEAENYIRRFDLDSNLLDEFRISSEIESVNEMGVTSREILILDKKSATIHRLALNGSYQGFYAADGVRALFTTEQGLWKSFSNRIEFENRSKQKKTIQLTSEVNVVDVQVLEGIAFILTAEVLFKVSGLEQ